MLQRLVLKGFETMLEGCQRSEPPVPKLHDGEQHVQLIAL